MKPITAVLASAAIAAGGIAATATPASAQGFIPDTLDYGYNE